MEGTYRDRATRASFIRKKRRLQAALDAEMKHAATLSKTGAVLQFTHFFFPLTTFSHKGTSAEPGTFLGVLDTLEMAFTSAYLAAVGQFVTLGHPELAEFAAEIMGIECEHRALGRSIANVNPANNLTLEKTSFGCVTDAGRALNPFLTGVGFATGVTKPLAIPTAQQAQTVIGKYGTRLVKLYL